MIFWKYKWFTMDKLPHAKLISVLLDICHHHTDSHLFSKAFSKLSLNLTMEPFKLSVILKIQLFQWRLPSRTWIEKTITISSYLYFYSLIFSLWFSRCNQIYSNIIQVFILFMKAIFPGSDTRPTQVGDMDPWPVTWPNLSDLIGWGQKISSTSW